MMGELLDADVVSYTNYDGGQAVSSSCVSPSRAGDIKTILLCLYHESGDLLSGGRCRNRYPDAVAAGAGDRAWILRIWKRSFRDRSVWRRSGRDSSPASRINGTDPAVPHLYVRHRRDRGGRSPAGHRCSHGSRENANGILEQRAGDHSRRLCQHPGHV